MLVCYGCLGLSHKISNEINKIIGRFIMKRFTLNGILLLVLRPFLETFVLSLLLDLRLFNYYISLGLRESLLVSTHYLLYKYYFFDFILLNILFFLVEMISIHIINTIIPYYLCITLTLFFIKFYFLIFFFFFFFWFFYLYVNIYRYIILFYHICFMDLNVYKVFIFF